MHRTQPCPLPERIYEPNIVHNPFTWMGIWTPQGWRVHRKRWGKAERTTVTLSGDGVTTFFPEALLHPDTGKVEWQDDLHLRDDPFTDTGIYPCDPRVEYPVGRPRWAVSHTLLAYPVADHGLYTHEYTWDLVHGHLQTHFRKHVALEEARTDSKAGMTVRVEHRPISLSIEGNVQYPLPNSAVRGVWAMPDKAGPNLYTERIVQLVRMHNHVYAIAPHTPVVQCYGMFEVLPGDPIDELFDPETGLCTDRQRVIDELRIPLDEPKVGMVSPNYRKVPSKTYEESVWRLADHEGLVDEAHVEQLRRRLGARFVPGCAGYAAMHHSAGGPDYRTEFDINSDGTIDEEDLDRLSLHVGRAVRYNLYLHAYFGGDWLTTVVGMTMDPAEPYRGTRIIGDYEYGGGYDAVAGTVRLLETPGPKKPVWIEYHYDAPAEAGENNICVHLYRETD